MGNTHSEEPLSTPVLALAVASDWYVVFADWLSIKSTCHVLHHVFCEKVAPQFVRNLKTKLHKELGATGILPSPNYVLTGGYLLGQLCDDVIEDSDLDFLVTLVGLSDMGNVYYSDNGIQFKSAKLVISGVTIDQITIESAITAHEFVASFDFDFCKNTFDGETLRVMYPESVGERRTRVTADHVSRAREFCAWYNEESSVSNLLMTKLQSRAQKYRQRGFIVDFDPDYFGIETHFI